MEKRPIDRMRESAGMIEIDDPVDTSGITGLVVIGKALHALKDNSIYEIKLGDDIDPKRINAKIPKASYQRAMALGSTSTLVQRTLLLGQVLFNKGYLPKGIDTEQAVTLAFTALQDFAAMQEIAEELAADQSKAVETMHKGKRGFAVPAVGNVAARFKSFIQKADHAEKSLLAIMRLFYGKDKAKNFESLAEFICHRHGVENPLCKLMREAQQFLQFVRNARNSAEHPNHKQKAVAKLPSYRERRRGNTFCRDYSSKDTCP
jgi:hypothetical protein